jgi:hypothetical protein
VISCHGDENPGQIGKETKIGKVPGIFDPLIFTYREFSKSGDKPAP